MYIHTSAGNSSNSNSTWSWRRLQVSARTRRLLRLKHWWEPQGQCDLKLRYALEKGVAGLWIMQWLSWDACKCGSNVCSLHFFFALTQYYWACSYCYLNKLRVHVYMLGFIDRTICQLQIQNRGLHRLVLSPTRTCGNQWSLPQSSDKEWKSHRQQFALTWAHQCGILIVDAGWVAASRYTPSGFNRNR